MNLTESKKVLKSKGIDFSTLENAEIKAQALKVSKNKDAENTKDAEHDLFSDFTESITRTGKTVLSKEKSSFSEFKQLSKTIESFQFADSFRGLVVVAIKETAVSIAKIETSNGGEMLLASFDAVLLKTAEKVLLSRDSDTDELTVTESVMLPAGVNVRLSVNQNQAESLGTGNFIATYQNGYVQSISPFTGNIKKLES